MTESDEEFHKYLISNIKTTEEQQSKYKNLVQQIKDFLKRQFNLIRSYTEN